MHLLGSDDLSKKEVGQVFSFADRLASGRGMSVKARTVLALLFEKPSTRTRVSFEAAMAKLGGASIYVDTGTSQMSRGETVSDTGRVLSSYVDMIAARLRSHSDLVELASSSTVPVINALTDLEHPTQALADMYTAMKAKGRANGIEISFVGDIAANTANSLMVIATKLGARVTLVGPKGYGPNPHYVKLARSYGDVSINSDPTEGVRDADILYTDTFVSMGQEGEAEKRRRMFRRYQINSSLLRHAKPDALVMHCLPAHRGEEISASVLEGEHSIVWEQAKNKMLIEEALILYLMGKKLKKRP